MPVTTSAPTGQAEAAERQNRTRSALGIFGRNTLWLWVDKVLVNLHSQSQMVRDFLAKTHLDIRVRLFEEPILLGSAGTLRANRAWVASEPSFWVFYADILTAANLTRMADFHRQHQGVATLGVCRIADPSRSGIVVVDKEGAIRQFI
jgi:mannose-1-phosphate guanylyltransferase